MIPRTITTGLLGCLLLSGCAAWQFPPERTTNRIDLPKDPLASSEDLAAAGRLGEALVLLDAAIAQGRNSPEYLTARERTLRKKTRLERHLQDRLLIEQTKAQQAQLPIYDEWARMDPDNRQIADQRKSFHQALQVSREQLSDCGLRQLESRPDLARTCLELAMALEPSQRDRLLLDLMAEKEKKTEQAKAQQKQDILEQQRKNRIRNNMVEAKVLYEKDQFNLARKLLNQVLAEEPDNPQAVKLLAELESRLQAHLDYLLKTGDKLYQEGQIEGAQEKWEDALRLDPENAVAKEKLERAKRVLENLESLRKAEESKDDSKQAP